VRRRLISTFLAAYLFVWFGIVIPAHRKGIVVIGSASPAGDCCCCCAAKNPDNSKTPAKPASQCEICNFAAHVTFAPPVDLSISPLGLLARAIPIAEKQIVWRTVLATYDGRAPPFAA
jgi:hypothetical protein